jgi:hypothetical protein
MTRLPAREPPLAYTSGGPNKVTAMRSMITRSIILGVSVVVLTLSSTLCLAKGSDHKQFRWKDATGFVHYSDTLSDDAIKAGYDIISDTGAVLKHIERARTTEERLADEEAAHKAAIAKREADERAEADRRMLAAFPTEADLMRARQAQLDSIDQSIVAETNSLNGQEQALSDNLAHAASLEHSGKKVPDTLQKQIESLRKNSESLRRHILRRQQEKIDATKQMETDLTHYREAREQSTSGSS